MNEADERYSTAEEAIIDAFFLLAGTIGCVIGILHKWILEDFASPPEEIALILAKMIFWGSVSLFGSAGE